MVIKTWWKGQARLTHAGRAVLPVNNFGVTAYKEICPSSCAIWQELESVWRYLCNLENPPLSSRPSEVYQTVMWGEIMFPNDVSLSMGKQIFWHRPLRGQWHECQVLKTQDFMRCICSAQRPTDLRGFKQTLFQKALGFYTNCSCLSWIRGFHLATLEHLLTVPAVQV